MNDKFLRIRNEANLVEINRKPDAIKQVGDTVFYFGYAWAGAAGLDQPYWSIERISIDKETGITLRMFPDGNRGQCIFKMSECETYNYQFAK